MATKSTKVSEKSTKIDIWEAYQQLIDEMEHRSVTVSDDPVKLNKMSTALSEAKASLIGHFEATIERLNNLQQSYYEADEELGHRKVLTIEAIENDKKHLDTTITAVRKQWQQEKADNELKHQREEDAYTYNLNVKRRNEEEAYALRTKEREAALKIREEAVAEQEKEIIELRAKVENFSNQLEEAINKTQEELGKELKAKHDNYIKELKQEAEHEKSILILKLQTAESNINAQAKQVTDLQKQLDSSTTQLKDMAVAVIHSKNEPSSDGRT